LFSMLYFEMKVWDVAANGPAVAQRLIERVEREARTRRARGAPAEDPPRENVDDDGDIDR